MNDHEKNQNLRTDYRRCSEHISTASIRTWQASAFLVGGAFAAAGLIIASGHHGLNTFISTAILGTGIIISLFLFKIWFLRRENWRTEILYKREEEIEGELGNMYSSRYVHWLDDKKKGITPNDIPSEKEEIIETLHREFPSPGPTAKRFSSWLPYIGIAVWIILIIAEASFFALSICLDT